MIRINCLKSVAGSFSRMRSNSSVGIIWKMEGFAAMVVRVIVSGFNGSHLSEGLIFRLNATVSLSLLNLVRCDEMLLRGFCAREQIWLGGGCCVIP
jgi:hypothetical protein